MFTLFSRTMHQNSIIIFKRRDSIHRCMLHHGFLHFLLQRSTFILPHVSWIYLFLKYERSLLIRIKHIRNLFNPESALTPRHCRTTETDLWGDYLCSMFNSYYCQLIPIHNVWNKLNFELSLLLTHSNRVIIVPCDIKDAPLGRLGDILKCWNTTLNSTWNSQLNGLNTEWYVELTQMYH